MTFRALVYGFLAGLVLVWGATGFFNAHRLLERLRERHPEVWLSLGRPSLLRPSHAAAVWQFLWTRQYRGLSDPLLAELGDRWHRYNRSSLVLLAALTVAMIGLAFLEVERT